LSGHPTRTISPLGPLFLWKSALNPCPCHLYFLPCSSIINCPCSSTSIYSGGGPPASTASISRSPCCEGTGAIADVRASMAPFATGSLFRPSLSRSLAAAATCAHPSLCLRPSQSLEEQKQVLACNAAIRAALAASCCAKMAALASLRLQRAAKNFWILMEGQLKSHETHVKRDHEQSLQEKQWRHSLGKHLTFRM